MNPQAQCSCVFGSVISFFSLQPNRAITDTYNVFSARTVIAYPEVRTVSLLLQFLDFFFTFS